MIDQLERNAKYDFLKFVGISCVILAHMGIQGILFQLRNFDVPLLVLLSGISFIEYSSINFNSYKEYIFKRFIRLIVPTWIFIVFYNIAIYLIFKEISSMHTIVQQFTLIGDIDVGIGVWIIRIFFTISIIAPFLNKINSNIITNNKFYIICSISFIVYEFVEYISFDNLDINKYIIIQYIIFYTVSYGFIFLYGLRMVSLSKKEIEYHIYVFAFIFVSYVCYFFFKNNVFIGTQEYKYPPRLYYISYSLFVSFALFYITQFLNYFNFLINNKIINFIGMSTLWIYLWHWFFLKLYNNLFINYNFLVKYLVVFLFAIIATYFQSNIVYFFNKYIITNVNTKKMLVKIFTG